MNYAEEKTFRLMPINIQKHIRPNNYKNYFQSDKKSITDQLDKT